MEGHRGGYEPGSIVYHADFFFLCQGAGEEEDGHCFLHEDCFHGGGLAKALGPGKFFHFMGVIIGLFHVDDPTAVQVLQAFRSCDPQPPVSKAIRGHVGQPAEAAAKAHR